MVQHERSEHRRARHASCQEAARQGTLNLGSALFCYLTCSSTLIPSKTNLLVLLEDPRLDQRAAPHHQSMRAVARRAVARLVECEDVAWLWLWGSRSEESPFLLFMSAH
jgi:hypothetical protein